MRLVTFEQQGVPWAVPLDEVREVVAADPADPDLSACLGLGAGAPGARDESPRSLVIGDGERPLRLRVGAVDLTSVSPADVVDLPQVIRAHPALRRLVIGASEPPRLLLDATRLDRGDD